MVYSTSRCPHCRNIVKKQTNPTKEIGNPFEKCPYCGNIYLDGYKQEWITKSPRQRFFFFIQAGVWARAFIFPLILAGIIGGTTSETGLMMGLWIGGFILWMIIGFFLHKNLAQEAISQSLTRTESIEYVELLKKAHYNIYPIEGVKYATRHEKEHSEKVDTDKKDDNPIENCEENKAELSGEEYFNIAEESIDNGDIENALENYNKASELNYTEADMSLGYIYLYGKGVRKNSRKAKSYFEKAQKNGNIYAKNILTQITSEKENKDVKD